jgi:hypothetical protein
MKVEVSIGEAIDKLSILEIKLARILDKDKKIEIQKEINALEECLQYKNKYNFYYNILVYVNEQIWNATNIIKSITTDHPDFPIFSDKIFQFNQKRFRIKNFFNFLTKSNINEQKSYSLTHCKIFIENEDTFFNKFAEIHYLSIEYDVLTFECSFISLVQNFYNLPTMIYDENKKNTLNEPVVVNLSDFSIPADEPSEIFSQKPISYIVGGMFGDFIQSLSIICEKFYRTGRKGILYISERGDVFRNGLENTYNDTYNLIMKQKYIHDFKIYNNESYDVDLVAWRSNPRLFKQNLYYTFSQTYCVPWGKTKWLEASFDDKWKNKVVINTTSYRYIDYKELLLNEYCNEELLFISSNKKEHEFFEAQTGIAIEYYEFKNFLELTTIINSCKLFIGSLSGPFCIANAMHKKRILRKTGKTDNSEIEYLVHSKLDLFIPNIFYVD